MQQSGTGTRKRHTNAACRVALAHTSVTPMQQSGTGTHKRHFCLSRTLQRSLESEKEAKIVQIDFSATFDIGTTIRGISISSA